MKNVYGSSKMYGSSKVDGSSRKGSSGASASKNNSATGEESMKDMDASQQQGESRGINVGDSTLDGLDLGSGFDMTRIQQAD